MTQTVIVERSNGKKLKRNPSDCSSAMMSKKQKFSKGHSSGFVPDYRHAAETMGETEGFSCSGHADSEASCTPKREHMSLNAGHNNSFNVPVQVITLSKMSGSERKYLEMRLRGELEKVRLLQMKILSGIPAAASGVAFSSSSDGHAKKESLKQGVSGRLEFKKLAAPPPPANSVMLVMKQCETLLKNLMQHKYSWVFNTPVDVVKLRIPDYFNIIKHPMDLGTVKKKLASGSYSNPSAFASDVRLTFTNAMTYNPPGNDVHIMADTLNKIFEKRWRPIAVKLSAAAEIVISHKDTNKSELPSMPKKRKDPPIEKVVTMSKSVKPKMPFDEKQELSNRLQALLEDLPSHIIDFLKQQSHNAKPGEDEDEIEIDIEILDDETLFELRKLLDEYFGIKQSVSNVKVKPTEMEMLVESGISNSSIPCQVNEPADEDVDIGGDDPPILSYPPLEIEKDPAPRSSKHSSSSSSSSDSDSFSDSDSGGSSGSEFDVKAVTPSKPVMENGQPEVARGLEKCVKTVSVDSIRTSSRMDQHEHGARLEPVSFEEDDCQEGENGTSKRQVSPDKAYRAALLKNRFADTILKAREKTLTQGDKKDPEKLRHEREELERQKREEKARIQAEAKAAEDARRREVAAEAKRKREIEREAARQALLQMEKTVEINENSFFLKDLEILGTAPSEHVPSTVHGMTPDHFQGLGGFSLGGSNPLEQLGLYRKDDDEDEEECGPTSLPKIDDFEEGEID